MEHEGDLLVVVGEVVVEKLDNGRLIMGRLWHHSECAFQGVVLGRSVRTYILEDPSPLSLLLLRFTLVSIFIFSVAGSVAGLSPFYFLVETFVVGRGTGEGAAGLIGLREFAVSRAGSSVAGVGSTVAWASFKFFSRLVIITFAGKPAGLDTGFSPTLPLWSLLQ